MSMRRDPMAAAAELIVLLESICKHPQEFLSYDDDCSSVESLFGSLVCTVGEISLWPSASNVIPGQAGSLPHAFLLFLVAPQINYWINIKSLGMF